MRRYVPITLAAAMLLAIPSGLAGWASYGDYEPNTVWDRTGGLMFPDEPLDNTKKAVYFNAFATMYVAGPNPNYAGLQTRNEVVPIESSWAILGVWLDCNGDGYIGMAEGALREYDATLLTDPTICAPVTGDQRWWDNSSHNYNGWVTEFVPVANKQMSDTYNTRQYFDAEAMVWADYGEPGVAAGASGGNCPLNPLPRGTLASTGGLINYASCATGLMGFANQPWADNRTIAGNTLPGVGDVAGLRFQQDEYGRNTATGHPIWDQQTLGGEDRSKSAFYTKDCTREDRLFATGATLNSTQPGTYELLSALPSNLNNTVHNSSVRHQDPRVNNDPASATVPATLNESWQDCDYEDPDDREGFFYGAVEDDQTATAVQGKQSAAYNLAYSSGSRGVRYNFTLFEDDDLTVEAPLGRGGASGMEDFGGQGVSPWFSGGRWFATNLIKGTPNTVVTRVNTQEGTANPGFDSAYWLTFWAYVGSASTSRGLETPGGSGKYGSEQCGLATSGVHGGWECDPAKWNLRADGTKIPAVNRLAEPGMPYNLRDVDCYDGGNSLGLALGLPAYGDEPCKL